MQTEKKTLKNMTIGEKLEHIWEYYKLVILAVAVVIAVIVYIIVCRLSPEKEILLNVVAVNVSNTQNVEKDIFSEYLEEHGYNSKETVININTALRLDPESGSQASAASYQSILAMIMTGEMDMLVGDEEVLELLGEGNGLLEMEDILPKKVLEKYQDRLYRIENPQTNERFVCGIRLPADNPLVQAGYYETDVLVGVPYSCKRQDMAREVLLYLLGESQ